MDTYYIVLIGIVVIGAVLYLFVMRDKKPAGEEPEKTARPSSPLQLQAYERLTLLTDRIAIPNLVSRLGADGLTAREMQMVLTRTIRDEFDHNITQQIYVTPETWTAVKDLKENNLLIINQVASLLPASASATDLNRALLEYMMNDPNAARHELVSQALSYEAKRHM